MTIQARFTFPEGFLWGTATSSYQVEGYNTNNDWHLWEQQGNIYQNHQCLNACEWWSGRWKEDLDRARESNQNAHRFSVEWSRVQPTPDQWDEYAIDQYREIARGMLDRGLAPMLTLHHFTNPLWIVEMGGWENDQVIVHFQKYVNKVAEALKEYIHLWCPINEPNIFAFLSYLMGHFPPGKKDLKGLFRVMKNLVLAQAAAYSEIHHVQPNACVGTVVHYREFLPGSEISPIDQFICKLLQNQFNDFFPKAAATGVLAYPFQRVYLPEVKGSHDFLGINYYTSELVSFQPSAVDAFFINRSLDPDTDQSETNFISLTPEGLFHAVEWGSQYHLPIYITENGIDDKKDLLRPRYLVEHLFTLWKALNFNWPVRGYFHWSLVDNFEWERGWSQRFGLWELDLDTQTRHKRPSADLYSMICQNNALTADMIAAYAPMYLQDLMTSR